MKWEIRRPAYAQGWSNSRQPAAAYRDQRLQFATDSRSDRAEPRNKFVENCRQ
jgi:hypothetical protein